MIQGARTHNLRDVDLVLPRGKLICLTGVSGSGKSSLAFDTVYAEGQRRYIESLSSFARQFLGQMPKPDVDFIGGLSPSISISQKTAGNNPRSTVGTITEIYDYLRVLFARVGQSFCPDCGQAITAQTREQILARILQHPQGARLVVLAPLIRGQKGEYRDLFADLLKQGFVRARVDGEIVQLNDNLQLDRQMRHDIEVVVDRVTLKKSIRPRLAEAVETALKLGDGTLIVTDEAPAAETKTPARARKKRGGARPGDIVMSSDYACGPCQISFQPPSPQLFSFNSPQGMCYECDGLGKMFSFDTQKLIPDTGKSFKQGCFELVGKWNDIGRWKRHIYQGVADSIERVRELPEETLLETPWQELPKSLQDVWLWGTDGQHITYTWRAGSSPQKYGGTWDGIIPELLAKYRGSESKMQIRQLEKYMSTIVCPDCEGERLLPQARSVRIKTKHPDFADDGSLSLPAVCQLPVVDAVKFFQELSLDETRTVIATEVLKEIRGRLGFLMNVGLDYLSLERTAPTLSGGESQRIRLAGQIGCGLVGVLYILDEPSIGLHARDNDRLLETLAQLRDLGNTVVVVEHDEDTMRAADHLLDFGPGPGVRGGELVASGSVQDLMDADRSVTGQYLSGRQRIEVPAERRMQGDETQSYTGGWLEILGAQHNNLDNIDVRIPLGALVCVTGVSGSGKSSLVTDIIFEALRRDLNKGDGHPGVHREILGLDHLDKLIAIDQTPIGRTPRSNPGTYIKVFDDIRNLFTQLPESKRRGYKPGRFSFNVKGGRCEACEGNGSTKMEMDFLADVWIVCPVCEGHRFNRETLQVRYKGRTIAEVLEIDIQQALELFENIPKIQHKLQTLHDVGLDYLKLGQPSPTLSGGEAQRIKLARELVKKSTGKTLYVLDEPTTGLHFADIKLLLNVLQGFVEAGNTVLVVEHNLDVIKTADWVIDLGPEGGAEGGQVVTCGTPEQIVGYAQQAASSPDALPSHTGVALDELMSGRARKKKPPAPGRQNGSSDTTGFLQVRGAQQHNLKGVDADIPRGKMTVFCGPSGSGKSSLAMDTIYAEGQRRYVESLSSYARQFVAQMQKPKLDHIHGLSPAIAIEQKNLGHTPRSTVGTVTEVYDYARILMARLGSPHCPDCDKPIGTQTADQIVDKILDEHEGCRIYLMAPLEVETGQMYEALWDEMRSNGYVRVRVDGVTHSLDKPPTIDRRRHHQVEIIVDRAQVRADARGRIADSIEGALALGKGVLHVAVASEEIEEEHWPVSVHSQHLACEGCGRSFEPLTPHNYSFNSQLGWCSECEGLGTQTGANPAALLRDPKLTLAEGAIDLWPDVNQPISQRMLAALSAGTGIPIDVPYEELSARQRRLLLQGTGDCWFDVTADPRRGSKSRQSKRLLFRFQFKGLYPALEEASRQSPSLRGRLEHLVDEVECSVCDGSRLRDDAAATTLREQTIGDLCALPLGELQTELRRWELDGREQEIAGEVIREILNRVKFLCDVGLEYLSLGRPATTLSGGEFQRIRLASQLGSGLCGVLYVLDEPTIGLHPRDNQRLLTALHQLRDLGNTLVIVEHDREVLQQSDAIFDFGPGAGTAGGEIVARGTPEQIGKRRKSVTGPYLSGKKAIPVPTNRRMASAVNSSAPSSKKKTTRKKKPPARKTAGKSAASGGAEPPVGTPPGGGWLEVIGARQHNLRNVDLRLPLGVVTAVTGVSGSGKSSLVDDILYKALARALHRAKTVPGLHDDIRGVERINKVIRVDQQTLGNSPKSNPATYTGAFELIRHLFAQLPMAKLRGYTSRRFSFNAAGGRCEECEGNGQQCIEMHFLPDVWVECDGCRGRRYNEETLEVRFHSKSINDVLNMSCGNAAKLFANIPKIRRVLQTLCDVGLDYLTLGQPAPTLSGGEAQRVKLAAELSRPDTGRTLYLLDEPTTGLHFDDLAKLLDVLHRLVDLGNTVCVIEHNMDIIKSADWVIDMGPEAGDGGGYIVAQGTPEDIVESARRAMGNGTATPGSRKTKAGSTGARAKKSRKGTGESTPAHFSHTGAMLAAVLEAGPHEQRTAHDFAAADAAREGELEINEVGRDQKMPWQIDGRGWHTRDRTGRDGQACRWEGRIVAEVVDRIQSLGSFSETDWNSRTIVEIAASKKSDGWFFHAITGETWLVKMKFRVAKQTFKRGELLSSLDLKTLNELEELPVYGNDPRVKCKTLRGPFQEVQVQANSWEEINTPEFWKFVDAAVAGFDRFAQRAENRPDDIMPWKKLGRQWHLSRKGFQPGKRVLWNIDLLEQLCEMLAETVPDAQFLWNNQQVVHVMPAGSSEPWASVHTKRLSTVDLTLNSPKGKIALGRIAELGREPTLETNHTRRDQVKLKFRTNDDLVRGGLLEFLSEHVSLMNEAVET